MRVLTKQPTAFAANPMNGMAPPGRKGGGVPADQWEAIRSTEEALAAAVYKHSN